MPTATPMGEAWEAKGHVSKVALRSQGKGGCSHAVRLKHNFPFPWMKLRDALGGKAGLGSCRRACPRLSPLVTLKETEPFAKNQWSLLKHSWCHPSPPKKLCSHRRLTEKRGEPRMPQLAGALHEMLRQFLMLRLKSAL